MAKNRKGPKDTSMTDNLVRGMFFWVGVALAFSFLFVLVGPRIYVLLVK